MSSSLSDNIIHVTDDVFEDKVLKADIPVLVDFWAEWCAPCRALTPILEEIAKEYAGKLIIAKVNVDESPEVSGQYGVRGIPTLILFKNGQNIETKVGNLPKGQLTAFIDSNL